MKKQYFNPNERSSGIAGIILMAIILIASLIVSIREAVICSYDISKIWIFLAIISFPVISIMFFLLYIKRYSGYFYIENDYLILVEGRKELEIKIEDIDVIRLTHYPRYRRYKSFSKETPYQYRFSIKVKHEKTCIPILITNSILYDILEPYKVKFRPVDFIKGVEDELVLIKKKTSKTGDSGLS